MSKLEYLTGRGTGYIWSIQMDRSMKVFLWKVQPGLAWAILPDQTVGSI